MIKKLIEYGLFLTALAIVYWYVYELSGVWKLPLISYVGTILVLAVFEVIEYKKNKEEDE